MDIVSVFMVLVLSFMISMSPHCTNAAVDFNEWFQQLDSDLHTIYRHSAEFAWNLSVKPTDEMEKESQQFNANKSKWSNLKCSEIHEMIAATDRIPQASSAANLSILEASAKLLCAGPKLNERQAEMLTMYSQQMQSTFVGTQICLPKQFDVCLNLDRIWDFTYVLHNGNELDPLNLDAVKPQIEPQTNLHLFDGNISNDYYINALDKVTYKDSARVEGKLRSGEMLCFDGEEDLDGIMNGDFSPMNRSDCALRFNEVFRWAWESWRMAVGPAIAKIYPNAIGVMNVGARANGFNNIGEIWRQEADLPNLQETIDSLMHQIKPFYTLLHGVLRSALWKRINKFEPFDRSSTVPAHMLGGMWSQNWQLYRNLIMPFDEFSMDKQMKTLNWTAIDMVKKADDFYRSLSLPAMTNEFWEHSIFVKSNDFNNCHGTAANMFEKDDFRMIACVEPTMNDLAIIVHEMGHLQYYMAYRDQPTIFQDGNAAMQESIGDAVFMGVMTPHHLNRLNILPDKYLISNKPSKFTSSILGALHKPRSNSDVDSKYNADDDNNAYKNDILVDGKPFPRLSLRNKRASNIESYESKLVASINDFDLVLLLQMALTKIPQIPFQYIMDTFRWNLFNGTILFNEANSFYWQLALREQGIHPPDWKDRRDLFDLGAKFHVADNTPFIRYFFASFIQAQIFEGLCKVTVYDTVRTNKPLPMPLHRCDIYGSKRAGKLLKNALKLGTSKHWTEVLYMLTGKREITADSLLLYYKPLIAWLNKLVESHDIPIGW